MQKIGVGSVRFCYRQQITDHLHKYGVQKVRGRKSEPGHGICVRHCRDLHQALYLEEEAHNSGTQQNQ